MLNRPTPEWLTLPNVLSLVLKMAELPKSFEKLALRLLKTRCGPRPWDLREAPENQRFLRGLAERGIDSTPWIDAEIALVHTVDDESFTFSLERDPLEVFAMGSHFDTCLSPGAFNYFSVFANAADINKQVLYGRNERGIVVARCLLALTETGGIVTFHPYCHRSNLSFPTLVKRFVTRLAKTMHTVVLPEGEIPMLVAPDWYDDGPVDITGQFASLDAIMPTVTTTDLGDVLALLHSALTPLALNELTLPMVISREAFDERPELIKPLYPLIRQNSQIDLETVVRCASLLTLADCEEDAQTLLPQIVRQATAIAATNLHGENKALELLVKLAPGKALQILKKTRARSNRSWRDEECGYRLFQWALANEKLHRRKQAVEACQLALKRPLRLDHRRECKQHLKRLGKDQR